MITSATARIGRWIDGLPWAGVLVVGGLLLLAPFTPEPHLVEKLRLLATGTLNKPLDIFDLALHASPLALVLVKVLLRRPA